MFKPANPFDSAAMLDGIRRWVEIETPTEAPEQVNRLMTLGQDRGWRRRMGESSLAPHVVGGGARRKPEGGIATNSESQHPVRNALDSRLCPRVSAGFGGSFWGGV